MKRVLFLAAFASLACLAEIPSPEQHFGHAMGEDRKLVEWSPVVAYFRALESASGKVRVEEYGRTVEGRPMIAAFISAPSNLQNLPRLREIQARLADPRRTSESEAEALIRDGKTVVMITCSIHSTEVASTMTAIQTAYNLITQKREKFDTILANTVFILVPSLNPDGVDIVARWYKKTLGTPFEGTSPPELYQKYVGHDNNRDWYIFSQPETRHTIAKLHNVWHPQIVYDVHQQGAYSSRMFVPPWLDPIDPNIDPIIAQLCNAIGAGMAADLTSAGKTGVAINAMYDFWTPARHYQAYHGGLRILSESASAKLATPIRVRPDELNKSALGFSPKERSWNHLEPWTGGEWRLRDIIEYQLIAIESCLFQAATKREDLLRSFYRIGSRAVARTKPNAFVIPKQQRDPGAARVLLDTLAFGMVEIEQAREAFEVEGKRFEAGSHVIRMQQPYSSFAKTLLERQDYPDMRMYPDGPPRRPYDVTAHTLPLLMGVDVAAVDQPVQAVLEKPVKSASPNATILPGSDTDSWRRINQIWKTGGKVWRDTASGDFHLSPGVETPHKLLRQPRVGLYKSQTPSMDEGWTRWLLDHFGFAFSSVANQAIINGNLNERFDVLVFPDQRSAVIHAGYAKGVMPDELTGGLGAKGAEALNTFASRGGTLVFLNDSTAYASEHLKLPVKDVLRGLSNKDFYSPGSLLNLSLRAGHPLTLGLPERVAIWSEGSPSFAMPGNGSRVQAVGTFPPKQILASGWLLGEKYLANTSPLLDIPQGSGHIVLFGMRPQYRAQSYQTFKLFFNALLYFE